MTERIDVTADLTVVWAEGDMKAKWSNPGEPWPVGRVLRSVDAEIQKAFARLEMLQSARVAVDRTDDGTRGQ